MTNKSDEEIIEEIIGTDEDTTKPKDGTESEEDALAKLSIKDDDSNNNSDDELQPISNKKDEKKSSEPNVIENEDKDDEGSKDSIDELNEEEFPIQKKQPKIFKILIAIAGLLSVVLVVGIILYFSGFFDPKPVEQPKVVQEVIKPKPEIVFDENDIDKKGLNKKLNMLTKKEIMTQEELEAEEKKIEEEKKRKEEEMQKALEEKKKEEELKLANQLTKIQEEKKALEEQQALIKQQQEEFIKLQEQAKKELEDKKEQILNPSTTSAESPSMEETKTTEDNQDATVANSDDNVVTKEDSDSKINSQEEEQTSIENNQNSEPTISSIIKENENKIVAKSFLSFINVATIKGELFKSYLDEIEKYNKKISLCRDMKNHIEIYFGPFDSQVEREKVYNNLIENGYKEAYLVDFTAEEYDKRCKY